MAYLTIPDAIHSGQLRKANTNNHNRFDDRATVFTIRTATQYTERWFPEGPRRFAPVLVIWNRAQPRQSAALENSTSGEFYITWGVPAQKTKSVWRVGKAGLGLKGSATRRLKNLFHMLSPPQKACEEFTYQRHRPTV